jgi:hypothetical protein
MSFVSEIENNNTTNSLNKIPIQSGTPTPGQSLVYNSTDNQWQFALASGSGSTGPTGPVGSTGPGGPKVASTSTSLGAIQLSGDLTGSATEPVIKTYTPNMKENVSLYSLLGQGTITGKTLLVPIAYSTSGTIGEFQFTQLILATNSVAIGLKSTTTPFTAYGTGCLSRIGSNVPLQLATLTGATITTTYKSLVSLSDPVIDGCKTNESEKWEIFLENASAQYCLQINLFNNINSSNAIFAVLYGLTV